MKEIRKLSSQNTAMCLPRCAPLVWPPSHRRPGGANASSLLKDRLSHLQERAFKAVVPTAAVDHHISLQFVQRPRKGLHLARKVVQGLDPGHEQQTVASGGSFARCPREAGDLQQKNETTTVPNTSGIRCPWDVDLLRIIAAASSSAALVRTVQLVAAESIADMGADAAPSTAGCRPAARSCDCKALSELVCLPLCIFCNTTQCVQERGRVIHDSTTPCGCDCAS